MPNISLFRRTSPQSAGHPLAGERVLITGAGSGIGRLMALEAARRGAEVVIWDLSEDSGAQTAAEIRAAGGQASSAVVNVADREAVYAEAARTGTVDVLINNAGIVSGARLMDIPDEKIERTMDVNVLSLFWVTKAFLEGMRAAGHGTVVTIASAAGWVGVSRQTDYSASKWAAVGFMESLRNELRAAGEPITTLTVTPYYISTGMFEGVKTKFPWLLPILEPESVGVQVIDAIESGKALLALPPVVKFVPGLRVLPTRLFDRVADFLGVNQGMDTFVGRQIEGPTTTKTPVGTAR